VALDPPSFIFNQIDQYSLGYITSRSLAEWLQESVGFKLNDFETRLVMGRYDKGGRYSISLAEFEEEVAPVILEQEQEEADGRQARLEEGYPGEEDGAQVNKDENGDNYDDDEFSEEEEDQDMRRRYMSGGDEDDLRGNQEDRDSETDPRRPLVPA
jgi:hypothetical protein